MLLNISVFLWFGAVCPWASFRSNNVIPIYRLIPLGILILLFRRLPMVFAMHKKMPEIEQVQQAAFVGFFGPIGVSAIFYLYISLEFLREITVDGEVREDAARLAEVMNVVIWFLAICSIVVHGLSVPLGKLGYHLPRTMSQVLSSDSREDQPDLPLRHAREPGASQIRRRKNGKRTRQPSPAAFRIGRTISPTGAGVDELDSAGEPNRPIRFIHTPPPGTQTPVGSTPPNSRTPGGPDTGTSSRQTIEADMKT